MLNIFTLTFRFLSLYTYMMDILYVSIRAAIPIGSDWTDTVNTQPPSNVTSSIYLISEEDPVLSLCVTSSLINYL